MSDDNASVRPRQRRRTRFVFVATAILLLAAVFAWWSHRWIDQRFVGRWRVAHNKDDDVEIYILNPDGSGMRLGQSGTTWRRIVGFNYGWSVSHDGFDFGNNPSCFSQLGEYIGDLGGLRSAGRLSAFRYFGGIPGELVSVTDDKIVLRFSREGIIKPDELTLTRIRQEDVPDWR